MLRETFEQQRMDIRALQRELQANKKALEPKVSKSFWKLASLCNKLSYYMCIGEDAV